MAAEIPAIPGNREGRPTLVIGVAGGSGSGKTTVVRRIVDSIGGDQVTVVEHDRYYRDRNDLRLEERAALGQRLNEREQEAFRRMAVFRGGFSRRAAQDVTDASLRTLTLLVNKSLLRRDPDTGHYTVHELLRQYVEEQLEQAGDTEAVRTRHMR